jgi:putative transcriptional regulator
MSLPESIKMTRQKLFMSQETFSTEINVSVATINRWENGRSKPNLVAMKSIKNFCSKYNVPFDDIEKEWFSYSVGEKEK